MVENGKRVIGQNKKRMKQYLLLLKGKKKLDYSPEELQKRLEAYREWVQTISEHYVTDNRLEQEGVHIKSKEKVLTDGPFLERSAPIPTT